MSLPLVFLDLDNTILDFSTAERNSLFHALREDGIEPTTEHLITFRRINNNRWERFETGELTRREVLVGRFAEFFEAIGISADAEKTQTFYEASLRSPHYFMPGAEALLEKLKGRYRLFILSNGNTTTQASRIASAKIAPYFEQIFISETIGFQKPSREYFEACFAAIPDFDSSRSVMVGDSLTSDIRGGKTMGLHTVWYNPTGRPASDADRPDETIADLSELPPLLEKLFPN